MRNRDETRTRILEASFGVLEEAGVSGFGINTVARAAGCDKKLIYRYFDGLDGLLQEMGTSVAQELVTALDTVADPQPQTYGALVEGLLSALWTFYRGNPRFRHLKALELSGSWPVTTAFQKARGAVLQDWVLRRRADLRPPVDADAPALNAFLISGVEGLALMHGQGRPQAGLEPMEDGAPDRVAAAIRRLVAAVYPDA